MAQSPLIVHVTHPRRDFTGITQLGLKAFALANAKKTALEPRLPAGTGRCRFLQSARRRNPDVALI